MDLTNVRSHGRLRIYVWFGVLAILGPNVHAVQLFRIVFSQPIMYEHRRYCHFSAGDWILLGLALILTKLTLALLFDIYICESKKVSPWGFLTFFPKRLGIFSPNFTRLCVPIYARLQIFIQLSATLKKLCHIKRDHPVHIISPSAETHAFRRLRKSLIALLIVVCGKSSQICHSAFFSSGMVCGFDWCLWNAWRITHHTW